jgi:cholinesterase
VVLGGESAGAASISLQVAINDGNATDLFHAAAIESVSFAPVLTVEESQYQYDNFAVRMNCVGNNSLACMRNKTAAELQEQNFAIPYPGAVSAPLYMFNPVLDYDLITDYTYSVYENGAFTKIPFLSGDVTNGGTLYAPTTTTTLAQSNVFLKNQFPLLTLEQLDKINRLYPNPNDTCPDLGCYWRQAANAYGDLRYMCTNLFVAAAFSKYGVKNNYNYHYNVEDPTLTATGYGVPHVTEFYPLWGPDYAGAGSPLSYYPNGTNALVSPIMQAYWTSFIRTFDPNTYRYPGSAVWQPVGCARNQSRMLFGTGGTTIMEGVDAQKRAQCDYLQGIGLAIDQ